MKTLLVTLDFPPLLGGISNYYYNRVKKIPAGQVVVLMNRVQGFEDVKFKNIYFKKFFIKYFWPHWVLLFWHVWRTVKKEGIEKVWIGQVLPVGTVVYFLSKILKFKYFVTCHGNDLLRAKKNKRKFKLAKKILDNAEFIEANTEFTKNVLTKDFGTKDERIKIIYPESVLNRKMADEKMIESIKSKYSLFNNKILLTVARLVESKGIDQIIKALDIVNDKNIKYLIIGDGQYRSALKKAIPSLLLRDNVIFIGSVAHQELPNYYALADAFILTPRKNSAGDTESFGVVYLEAKEFGLPIIASDVGGIKEALKNYNNFTLVDSENINQIADNIIKVLA